MTGIDVPRRPQPGDALTFRELEVLGLASHGLTNGAIGERLFITENTVKAHMRKLLVRLDARDRAHAVRRGFQRGILTDDDEQVDR